MMSDLGVASITDRSSRLRLKVTGPDRVRFLQNLTTNNVSTLQPTQGVESFITSPQGKTLGYVTLHVRESEILVRSDPPAYDILRPHFEKYGVFDDVAWAEVTAETFEVHLFGTHLQALLARLDARDLPEADYGHGALCLGDQVAIVIRERPAGWPGATIIAPRETLPELTRRLDALIPASGLCQVDPEAFDVMRIEAGTPAFGRDVTPANLPQEIDRDDRAICFTKGCYLGQEPVARIDALGHVNKLLRGLRFDDGLAPEPGTSLFAEGKAIGAVTSSGYSKRLGTAVGLGFVRRAHATTGQVLMFGDEGAAGTATIISLPMLGEQS